MLHYKFANPVRVKTGRGDISNPECIGFCWVWLELLFAQSGLQWVGNTYIINIEKGVKKLKNIVTFFE